MTTSTTYETEAERRAYHYAQRLAAAGWEVTVTITDTASEHYGSGDIMLPGFRQASFLARRAWFDASISGHWLTFTEVATGRRRTTRFTGGSRYPMTLPVQDIATERALAIWVGIDCDSNTAGAQGSITTVHQQGHRAG